MKSLVSTVAVLSAVITFQSVCAQEAPQAASAEAEKTVQIRDSEKEFTILPFCRIVEGKAEVLTPTASDWAPIQEGKYYPLGTSYRTMGDSSRLVIQFGHASRVSIQGEASFGTVLQNLGVQSRTVTLLSGTIEVDLPRNLSDGLFSVSAPGFSAYNLSGLSRYTYSETAIGYQALIHCVTGQFNIKGRHFEIVAMRPTQQVRIETSHDQLFTGLFGTAGDCLVKLEQGRIINKDYATGETKLEDKVLDWRLSPNTAVRIYRAKPSIGERMAVSVLTFDASGEMKNRCAFTEGEERVNSGEIGPTSKKDRDSIAKQAAEAAQAAETATVEVEEPEAAEESEESATETNAGSDDLFLEF